MSWGELFDIANQHGDWLSIHTDYRWGGSYDLLENAKQRTERPILAKGIHSTDEEVAKAVECGADYVLVVGRVPGVYVEQCLVEVADAGQFMEFDSSVKAVWNQRNLANGARKAERFDDVRHIWPNWLAQASFIRYPKDVCPDADAFIVGTHLAQFVTSLCRD